MKKLVVVAVLAVGAAVAYYYSRPADAEGAANAASGAGGTPGAAGAGGRGGGPGSGRPSQTGDNAPAARAQVVE
jgi:hypothetical protein